MSSLYQNLLFKPLVSTLVFLYNYITFHDLGIAIILLTFIIRTILFPLFYKSFRNQTLMQKIQPEIARVQETHKHNKEKQAQAMMELYRQHKVNPLSGFVLILIQLPILIALFQVFSNPPAQLNHIFLGFIDLKTANLPLLVLVAILQYFQGRLSLPKTNSDSPSSKIAKNMVFFGPLLTIIVLFRLPSAISVYWLATTVFTIGQQIYINKTIYKDGTNSGNNPKTT